MSVNSFRVAPLVYRRRLLELVHQRRGKCNETRGTQDFISLIKRLDVPHQGSVDLLFDHQSCTSVVNLNNPKAKNALDGAMMIDLLKAVQELERWKEGKAVVLAGTGGFFCSGGDLSNFVRHLTTPEDGVAMCQFMQDVTMRLSRLPLISVAAIQGAAIGGGAELATACDFRLMSPTATIVFAQKRLGVTTGWGGGSRLVKIVGRRKALDLLIGTLPVEFPRAEEIGLVDGDLSDCKDPLSFCTEWLQRKGYLTGDASLIQSIKSMTAIADDYSVDIALANERDVFGRHWGSIEHSKSVNRLLERSPKRES